MTIESYHTQRQPKATAITTTEQNEWDEAEKSRTNQMIRNA